MARPRTISDEDILETARSVFLEHGYGVPTSEIASKVGLSAPALFKRFGTKEALFLAALAPSFPPKWVLEAQAGPDDRPFREQLRELVGGMTEFFKTMIPRFTVLKASGCMHRFLSQTGAVSPPALAFETVTAWFERARNRGLMGDVEPRAAAEIVMAAVAYRHFSGIMLGDAKPRFLPDDEAYLDQMVHALCDGLEPERDPK